jgi:hypothetical protein
LERRPEMRMAWLVYRLLEVELVLWLYDLCFLMDRAAVLLLQNGGRWSLPLIDWLLETSSSVGAIARRLGDAGREQG